MGRVAGMSKKAVYRSSGEAGPRRGRLDPSHQDCCSRSAARLAPEYGHPRRSVVCTHLCTAERLCAFAPHTPERVARTSVGATFRATRGWARAAATGSPRAKYSDEWYLSPLHPSRQVGSKSKHSQVPVLRPRDRAHPERDAPRPPQRQGQGRRALPSLPRLAARCLPYVSWCTAGVCSQAGRADAARRDVLLGGGSLGRAERVRHSNPLRSCACSRA